ncbi:MAG: alpha/beta hydrolase [Verrucomicrobiaceae bacterium]|nr:alpha/beta hydrolase [Verrucomicrobiaceae bacterium]
MISLRLPLPLFVLAAASSLLAQTPAPKAKTANDYVAQLVAKLSPTRQLVYKKVADRELKLHVFQPDGWKASDKRTCFITIHGGGWTGMGPERMYAFADHFAKLGLVSISVQYRLASAKTNTTVFDCVKDVRSAVRYVKAHAGELGIDPGKIIASGGSAGGHLAASTAMFDGINEKSDDLRVSAAPNALVLLFPVIDTSKEGYGNARIGERWQEISPAHNVRPGLPPTITFHGTADPTTPFKGAQIFHEAMLKAGNRSELVIHEGGDHGYLMRTQPLYDECLAKTDAFLKSLHLLP